LFEKFVPISESKVLIMSTAKLKQKVLQRIKQIDEDYLLEDLLNLIEIEEEDHVEISKEQKEMLDIGLKQVEEGKTTPNEIVEKRIEKWLNK